MDNVLVLSDEQLESVVGGSGGFNKNSHNFNGNHLYNSNGNFSRNYADVSSHITKATVIDSLVDFGNTVWQNNG